MCFSVQVDKDIVKLAKLFKAQINDAEFKNLEYLQGLENKLSPDELKKILGLKRKPQSQIFKECDKEERIYPNYFAPVIIGQGDTRSIIPMRYRIRPSGSSEEIPSKYNVFNARLDSLETRQTWSNIFMRNHGLFPFKRFFEWVEDDDKKKKLISFSPTNREIMWAPCLWDYWTSNDGKIKFYSFALITTDPPPEISEAGHDRCPIFLDHTQFDDWLNPQNKTLNEEYAILGKKEEVLFHRSF